MQSIDPDFSLHVVAGVIRNENGEILLSRRPPGRHQAGKWEFPGGKVEAGETAQAALARELGEELGISASNLLPRIQVPYRYPDREIQLDVYDVLDYSGEPRGLEDQELTWVPLPELTRYEYPAANLPILTSLALPDWYAISNCMALGEKRFLQILQRKLGNGLRLLQVREPEMKPENFTSLSHKIVAIAHRHQARVLLNTDDPSLVKSTRADGIHLNSGLVDRLQSRPLPGSHLVAASCHSKAQLEKAQQLSADFVVLSPVQSTASHPEATPIGWDGFAGLAQRCAMPIYALGGMKRSDVNLARQHGGQGIAAIGDSWK